MNRACAYFLSITAFSEEVKRLPSQGQQYLKGCPSSAIREYPHSAMKSAWISHTTTLTTCPDIPHACNTVRSALDSIAENRIVYLSNSSRLLPSESLAAGVQPADLTGAECRPRGRSLFCQSSTNIVLGMNQDGLINKGNAGHFGLNVLLTKNAEKQVRGFLPL